MAYDMIRNRRRILLNTPHKVREISQEPVISVSDPSSVILNIDCGVKQAGSGLPSVTNKRAITPLDSVSAYVDGVKVVDKSLGSIAGTAYNAYYDSQTGVATGRYTSQTISTSGAISSYSTSGNSSIFWGYAGNLLIYNDPAVPIYSNMFIWTGYHYGYDNVPDWSFGGSSSYPNSFWVKVPTSALSASSLAAAQQWVVNNPIQIVAPRKTGGDYSASIGTSSVVLTRGSHAITTDTSVAEHSKLDITYWTNGDIQNLYSLGTQIAARNVIVPFELPAGTYKFSAVVTSTDTDDTTCRVRFEDSSGDPVGDADGYLDRSASGESHSLIFHCTGQVARLNLFAATNLPRGKGDVAIFSKIRIEQVG